jgi:hypothetical protein
MNGGARETPCATRFAAELRKLSRGGSRLYSKFVGATGRHTLPTQNVGALLDKLFRFLLTFLVSETKLLDKKQRISQKFAL